jgi:hypothetical protein
MTGQGSSAKAQGNSERDRNDPRLAPSSEAICRITERSVARMSEATSGLKNRGVAVPDVASLIRATAAFV